MVGKTFWHTTITNDSVGVVDPIGHQNPSQCNYKRLWWIWWQHMARYILQPMEVEAYDIPSKSSRHACLRTWKLIYRRVCAPGPKCMLGVWLSNELEWEPTKALGRGRGLRSCGLNVCVDEPDATVECVVPPSCEVEYSKARRMLALPETTSTTQFYWGFRSHEWEAGVQIWWGGFVEGDFHPTGALVAVLYFPKGATITTNFATMDARYSIPTMYKEPKEPWVAPTCDRGARSPHIVEELIRPYLPLGGCLCCKGCLQ